MTRARTNTDRTRLPDASKIIWFFFGFQGRIDRQAFALGGLLLYVARLFPVYRIITTTDEAAQSFWGGIFLVVIGISLVSHVAMCAKRLHDMDRSAWLALFFVIGDILMFLVLCFIPGSPGQNRYGSQTNAPR